MKTAETINRVCEQTGITKSELARRMGMHPSSLYRKLGRETMTFEEFQKCLDALNVNIEFTVHYPDGSNGSSSARQELILEKMAIVESELEISKKALEFYRKTIKDIRTELHSALAYADIGTAHEERIGDCIDNIKAALENMEAVVSCVTGENLQAAGDDDIDVSAIQGKRVLIVDDNQINREVLREVLHDSGLETEEAADGSEAVAKIKDCEPGYYDFILMDLEMPVMDGFEAVSVIRNLPNRIRASIPVIALTANDIHENREKAFAVGMDDYIMKPADSKSLLRGLARLR
ncbi:MAG: response regulator [Lentihominibacter sp.]